MSAAVLDATQLHSRRAILKRATDSSHRALDAAAATFELENVDHYRSFLEASAAAILPLEALLTASDVVAYCPDWSKRARSRGITHDLAWVQGQARPLALERPPLSPSEVFGMLYVLEGSRLGARVLVNRVNEGARAATHYLGANDSSLWRSFLQELESATALTDMDSACDAARYTFSVFARAFSPEK